MKKSLLFFLLSTLLSGVIMSCASYKIFPIDGENKNQEGLRFYKPQPYLLVSYTSQAASTKAVGAAAATVTQTDLTLDYKLIFLPDYTQGFVMQRRGGMGTVDASVKLTDGWMLTELGMKTDSQVPQTIEALSKLIPTLPGLKGAVLAPGGPPPAADPSGLYKISFDNTGKPSLEKVKVAP
jgi:hypothetical protein